MRDGEPCNHKGCLSHISHPCEGCGRIAGRNILESKNEVEAYFNLKDINNACMSKREMYKALSGKSVKCTYIEKDEMGLFAVELQDNNTYILDQLTL
jgi:hypothetical protein